MAELAEIVESDLGLEAGRLSTALWYTQHGPFSYYENFGEETFTELSLERDSGHYHDPIEKQRLLTWEEADELRRKLSLAPVDEVLTDLGQAIR